MFPILKKDMSATMLSTMEYVNVEEKSTVSGDLDVPDISKDKQLPMYETGVDATIVSWVQGVSVVDTHSTQTIEPTSSNPATPSL
jgi:hypothetical protein